MIKEKTHSKTQQLLYLNIKNKSIGFFLLIFKLVLSTITGSIVSVELIRLMTNSILNHNFVNLRIHLILFLGAALSGIFLNTNCGKTKFEYQKAFQYTLENELIACFFNNGTKKSERLPAAISQNITETVLTLQQCMFHDLSLLILLISGFIYAAAINFPILLMCTCISIIITWISTKKVSLLTWRKLDYINSQNEVYTAGWEQVKNREAGTFLLPKHLYKKYEEKVEAEMEAMVSYGKVTGFIELCTKFGIYFFVVIIFITGIFLSFQGLIYPADLLALVLIVPKVCGSIFMIPQIFSDWHQFLGCCQKLDEMYQQPAKMQTAAAHQLSCPINQLTVSGISHGFADNKLLNQVSFQVKAGEYVCFTGASGSGKSTLFRILAHLEPIQSGTVLFNNIDSENIAKEQLWKKVIYVSPNPVVLPDTLYTNLTMGNPVDGQRLDKVRRLLNTGNSGIPTELGSEIIPSQLSSGERQKIALARALLLNRDIYLLDECMSALDPESEKVFLGAIKEKAVNESKIVLSVSHRIMDLEQAHMCFYLAEDYCIYHGTHKQLIQERSDYRKLLQMEVES